VIRPLKSVAALPMRRQTYLIMRRAS